MTEIKVIKNDYPVCPLFSSIAVWHHMPIDAIRLRIIFWKLAHWTWGATVWHWRCCRSTLGKHSNPVRLINLRSVLNPSIWKDWDILILWKSYCQTVIWYRRDDRMHFRKSCMMEKVWSYDLIIAALCGQVVPNTHQISPPSVWDRSIYHDATTTQFICPRK